MSGAKTQQEFLDVVGRVTDGDWLSDIRDVGPGYELLRAQAAMMERASLAISHADDCLFIASAPAGSYSSVEVRFTRASDTGALTIKVGSIVSTTQGRRFVVRKDLAVGSGVLVSDFTTARADFMGYEWNVAGQRVAADGTVIPGAISVADLILTDPPMADLTFTVENVDPAAGGAPPVLGAHGADRGLPRYANEPFDAYRERIRSLPLAITKQNILAALTSILSPYGIAPTMTECFEADKFGALDWDGPAPPFVPDAGLFPNDVAGTWPDVETSFGCFFITLPPIQPIGDFGLLLDSPTATTSALVSPDSGGLRCVGAFDMDNTMADDGSVLLPALDGFDEPKLALLNGLDALLRRIKMGGIVAIIILQGEST